MLDSCGLSVYLAKEVEVNRVVDGHEVVQSSDRADIVCVVYRCGHALRVLI